MRAYIKKLQTKSEETRKQILIGSLIVCMSFVGLIWINSLGYKFSKENTTSNIQEEIKPFALFSQTISNSYDNVSASVGNISSSLKKESKEIEIEKVIDLTPVEYQ